PPTYQLKAVEAQAVTSEQAPPVKSGEAAPVRTDERQAAPRPEAQAQGLGELLVVGREQCEVTAGREPAYPPHRFSLAPGQQMIKVVCNGQTRQLPVHVVSGRNPIFDLTRALK